MTGKRRLVAALLVLNLFLPAGCRLGGEAPRPSPQRKAGRPKPAKPFLPPQFSSMESNALRLYSGAGGGWSWAEAPPLQEKLRADWGRLQGDLKLVNVPRTKLAAVEVHLNGIDTGIKTKDRFKVAEQANELIGALQGLSRKFQSAVPAELILLQTDVREIRLHAGGANWSITKELLKSARQDWEKLKPKGKEAGAEALGKNIESYFKELEAAVKAKDAGKTEAILDRIDSDLETLRTTFTRQFQDLK